MTLAPDEDGHLASRDIPDVEAFALYLRARQEFPRATEASLDLAQRLVERALARTGPNALLLATAAEIRYWLHDQGIRPVPETLDQGDALATRALELAPDAVILLPSCCWVRASSTPAGLAKRLKRSPGSRQPLPARFPSAGASSGPW